MRFFFVSWSALAFTAVTAIPSPGLNEVPAKREEGLAAFAESCNIGYCSGSDA